MMNGSGIVSKVALGIFGIIVCLTTGHLRAGEINPEKGWIILHRDGTATLSRVHERGELQEWVYDKKFDLILSKRVLLDKDFRPIQGVAFDGGNKLLNRVEYGYDKKGQIREQRTYDSRGKVARRVIFQYEAKGDGKEPLVFDFDAEMKPRRIPLKDFRPFLGAPDLPGGQKIAGDVYFSESELQEWERKREKKRVRNHCRKRGRCRSRK